MDDKKKRQIIRKNFLESLKELSGSVAKSTSKDLIGGVGKTVAKQIFGLYPNSGEFNQTQYPSTENKEKFQWSRQDYTDIRVQERLIFKQTEREIRVQIEAIRSELSKLVKSADLLSHEVQIASIQSPVEPGVYHVTFLERIREFLIILRKNITESANWLALCNQKTKKRNFYWGQVKKSGTKFMLSAERYMSTQAG